MTNFTERMTEYAQVCNNVDLYYIAYFSLECIDGCVKCSDGATCTKCDKDLFYSPDTKKCGTKCSDGYNKNESKGLCELQQTDEPYESDSEDGTYYY